ncbi:DUF5134 domain-containing protein [Promicromonospora iranensis]|uniref:DUF5134 domain-containing protein n=1 Tax=Promicromonospora iranensis TaxID=1105144 RepID=A0ABU2CWD6_9MICO|nr:DUF5134 domain-containing protein [Promicromonospora iranensis]MDR7385634.1 hypothetical protein [Promicromonospora iranensis]
MTSDPVVQWATTGLFALLTVHSLWRLVTVRQVLVATGYLFHLGMSAVMVAMVWPWWARLPVLPQLVFFALAAGFFAAAAGWRAADVLSRGGTGGGLPTAHHESARAQVVHAAMMLAMVWAVAAMSPGVPSGSALSPGPGHGHGHAAAHVVAHAQLGGWAAVSGALLAAALAVGGSCFVVGLVRHLRHREPARARSCADLVASAAMSLGTAGMCWLMLVG